MLLAYLKRQYKLLLLLAGAVCIFAEVFALYDLPLEAVVYAGGLCLALGITKRQFKALKANKCFCNDVEMALLKIEAYIEENSISGGINGALATAILKENFGWGAKDDAEEGKIEISLSGEADKYAG